MSVLSALFDNKIQNFEQAFGAKDVTTPEMRRAIQDWYGLYYMDRPTKEENPCQRLPVVIVNKLTKTAFSEYKAETGGEGAKGKYIQTVLEALDRVRKKAMQQALIGGACLLKPVFTPAGVCFGVVERRNYLVLGRNERDEITDVGTAERTTLGKQYYTLLERRTIGSDGRLTIESRLYRADTADILGTQVPLASLEKYAALRPVNTLPEPMFSLGLIPVNTPMENCVDGSPDCVSVYAAAAGLIHQINVNEAQLGGEFERGQSRIIASADMVELDPSGQRRRLADDVFTGVDESPDEVGITIFSPALREQSFLARKMEYLRNVESVIGLKRGILSEVEAAQRTATEITSSAGDYNLTIIDFQQMWERAVRESVRVCDVLGRMYGLRGGSPVDPEKDISIDFGNGVLYDEDKVWADYMAMVASGMMRPEIALAWKFNLPWETPEDLEKIRRTYLPELDALTGGD